MTDTDSAVPTGYLVTAALPYANGRIHIGHLAGAYLPADICVRYLRLRGRSVVFVCGSDENGVAITKKAREQGLSPEALVEQYHRLNEQAFAGMDVIFDVYGRTSEERHTKLAQEFFLRHHERGHVQKRTMEQPFCTTCEMYLPDRYIEGTCHHCQAPGAKGDQCEACGKMIDATKLIEPLCTLCGASAIEVRATDHWFFRLDSFEKELRGYLESHPHFRDNVKQFANNLLKEGLRPRPITRDLTWGVPVPLDGAEGKVLYVWFDAPIGYVTFTQDWAAAQGNPEAWRPYWQGDDCRILHFIGKDNIVFHSIIWPAMLMGHGDYQLPHDVVANEFLNIKGSKTSTSRNHAVWIDEYLQHFGADPLRYYLTAIAPEGSDSDFSWEDFQVRNNTELADTLGNFIQRNLVFACKYFEGRVPPAGAETESGAAMVAEIEVARQEMAALLEAHRYKAGLERLMRLAQAGNQFLEQEQPWKTRKTDMARCGAAVHLGLRTVEALSVLMAPFCPAAAGKLRGMLNLEPLADGDWDRSPRLQDGAAVNRPEILFRKFEDDEIAPHVAGLNASS